jgi:hypothetical protein
VSREVLRVVRFADRGGVSGDPDVDGLVVRVALSFAFGGGGGVFDRCWAKFILELAMNNAIARNTAID